MADVSLMAVPPDQEGTRCASCGAEVVADQRYCLACGHPVSPVRLAFLDVLQEDSSGSRQLLSPGTIEMAPVGYAPAPERGLNGWLRRNSGLLSLLAVLVLCLIAGLLIGHWVTQNNTKVPSTQVVKVEGLGGSSAPLASSPSASPGASTGASAAHKATSAKKEEEEELKEAAKEEAKAAKTAAPAPVKASPTKLQKLSNSTGKKHTEEINALGNQPIETGG